MEVLPKMLANEMIPSVGQIWAGRQTNGPKQNPPGWGGKGASGRPEGSLDPKFEIGGDPTQLRYRGRRGEGVTGKSSATKRGGYRVGTDLASPRGIIERRQADLPTTLSSAPEAEGGGGKDGPPRDSDRAKRKDVVNGAGRVGTREDGDVHGIALKYSHVGGKGQNSWCGPRTAWSISGHCDAFMELQMNREMARRACSLKIRQTGRVYFCQMYTTDGGEGMVKSGVINAKPVTFKLCLVRWS